MQVKLIKTPPLPLGYCQEQRRCVMYRVPKRYKQGVGCEMSIYTEYRWYTTGTLRDIVFPHLPSPWPPPPPLDPSLLPSTPPP